MNWKEETIWVVKQKKELREKRFIKEELMRYYFYIEKFVDLKVQSAAILKETSDINTDLNNKITSIQSSMSYYEFKLELLDKWLNCLTPNQLLVVKTYICEYQCEQRNTVAELLNYSTESIKKITERSILKIYQKYKNDL